MWFSENEESKEDIERKSAGKGVHLLNNTENKKKYDDEGFDGEKKKRTKAQRSKLLSVLVEILILLGVGVVFMVLRNDLSIGEAVPPHAQNINTCCLPHMHINIRTHAHARADIRHQVYFCVITATTIGYGDFSPKYSGAVANNEKERNISLWFGIIYCTGTIIVLGRLIGG